MAWRKWVTEIGKSFRLLHVVYYQTLPLNNEIDRKSKKRNMFHMLYANIKNGSANCMRINLTTSNMPQKGMAIWVQI